MCRSSSYERFRSRVNVHSFFFLFCRQVGAATKQVLEQLFGQTIDSQQLQLIENSCVGSGGVSAAAAAAADGGGVTSTHTVQLISQDNQVQLIQIQGLERVMLPPTAADAAGDVTGAQG